MMSGKVDAKGRIFLNRELYGVFENRGVYLRYDSQEDQVLVMDIDGVLRLKADIGRVHSPALISNFQFTRAMSQMASSISYSRIQKSSRLCIPPKIRESANINPGDILEARVVEGKGIALKKSNPNPAA